MTLSCFEWKNLFHSLKYSNLLGDFSAYFAYVLLKFHFVIYCNSEHFKIFSNWNSNVFAMELGLNLGLSHYYCLVLGSVSPHAVLLIPLIDMGKTCRNRRNSISIFIVSFVHLLTFQVFQPFIFHLSITSNLKN